MTKVVDIIPSSPFNYGMNEDHIPEGFPDMQEVRRRRQEMRRRRKVCFYSLTTGIASLLIILLLFSPIGPFGHVIFGQKGQAAGEGARAEESRDERAPGGGDSPKPAEPRQKASLDSPPCVAIVVDDVGNGDAHLQEWLSVDAPLTFSVMPYYELGPGEAERLYQAGFQVMLHVPTVNAKPNSYSGKGQLEIGMDRATVFATLDADLAQVPHVVGMNNHQGGAGCDDLGLMTLQCEWAKERGLFVVDSNSSAHSQVSAAAVSLGMPRRKNQVFIDHDNDPEYIRKAMRNLADIARRNGYAIGICHWHRPNTARTVGEMVKVLRAEGINFAFVQDISN